MPPLFPEKVESIRHLSTKSWEATFTKDYLSNEGQLRFLSRMCYLAMAHYLLYRGVLPKGVFKRRKLEDLAIYCFDGNTRWGRKLSEMMKGIREAIDQKYIKQAFVMINEDKEDPDVATEVFSVGFCYNEQHTMTVLDDKGNRIVSFGYKGEKVFRMQVKHIIKKLSVVTKNLEPLKKGAVPYLKLTYYENTPDDYEPSMFKHCENTYTFNKSNPPTFYKFGDISNKETAMSFVLESVYIKGADVSTLDDLLFDQAGYKDNDEVNMLDVTADGFFASEEVQQTTVGTTPEQTTHSSEQVEKARQDKDDFLMESFDSPAFKLVADESDESGDYVQINKKTRESPYVKGRPKRSRLNSPRLELSRFVPKSSLKSSVSHRSVLKSPNDNGPYVNSPITLN
ncbi:hypothetical protein niasHS_010267 [Heterodera schachtii]|uniref:HORMA domain-containing protein n=1 Tax=Heterodera schachtii TaxID=97005 RepID=A0ABD2IZR0_HETSC